MRLLPTSISVARSSAPRLLRIGSACALVLTACAGPSPRTVPAPPPAVAPLPATPLVVPAPAGPDPSVALNLDFEEAEGDRPKVWAAPRAGIDFASDDDVKHGGERSLRLRSKGDFAVVAARHDVRP